MAPSKSKRTAPVVRSAKSRAPASKENRGLPSHPAMQQLPQLVRYRMGSTEPLRLPDEINTPSAAKLLRSDYTITADAAGHAVFGEAFNLSGAKLAWTVTAGTTGTSSATAHPQNTAFQAEARVARMVAMRISVTYIGAEQTSAGYLSFQEKVLGTDVDSTVVDALHTGCDAQVRATDGMVAFVDYTQLPRWEVPSNAAFMQYTFPLAVFIASGLPASTACFRVRVERFLEYLPIEGTLSEGEVRHEPHDPGALGAHGALTGVATSVLKQSGWDSFKQTVRGAANAAYHMVQPLMPYVVDLARSHLVQTATKTLAMAA